jgi:hypothetical protein
VHLANGEIVREKLLALSDYDHSFVYQILMPTDAGSARGAPGAIAKVRLWEITQSDVGATLIEWSHEFEAEQGPVSAIEAFYNSIYPHFFNALSSHVSTS